MKALREATAALILAAIGAGIAALLGANVAFVPAPQSPTTSETR